MNKLKQSILLQAHKNHTHERRNPCHWRVFIKSNIQQNPFEQSEKSNLICGFNQANWMGFKDLNAAKNLIGLAKNELEMFLASHHIEHLEPSRTNNIEPEIFLKLGFVFVASHKFYEKSKAYDLLREWQQHSLDSFIAVETPGFGADLYASEALSLSKYANMVQTSHLTRKGNFCRVPANVEPCLVGENRDVIEGAAKLINSAFENLEKQGLAVIVQGCNLCFTWTGLSLTKAGVSMAEQLKEAAYQAFLDEQASRAPKSCKIRCLSCGEILLRTTSFFRADKPVVGKMIELLPNLSKASWNIGFGPADSMEAICCINCGERLIDFDSGRFLEDVLIPYENTEDINEPEVQEKT